MLRALVRRLSPLAVASVALVVGATETALAGAPAAPGSGAAAETTWLLRPDRVFDGAGETPHAGWAVVVTGAKITAVGPAASLRVPAGARVIDLAGTTLLPGLIDAHSHVFLHPYDETPWNDQVLKEPLAYRTIAATLHARATLMAGFTTLRDLGTEGAGDADVGLKQAIERGIIPGPRLLVATRAIVATGSYGPKGFDPRWDVPQGAEEADGVDGLVRNPLRRKLLRTCVDHILGPALRRTP